MRVLSYGLSPLSIGGVSIYLVEMSRFIEKDIIFDYVVEGSQCIYEEEIEQYGGKIYYIHEKTSAPILNLMDNMTLLRSLRQTHEAVYFNVGSLSWIEPINFARSLGYRVYVHSHMSDYVKNDLIHRLIHKINKMRLSKMDITRLACSFPAKSFMFYPDDPVIIVNNAIDIQKYSFKEEKRDKIKRELNIQDNQKIIGFVGRITKQKNPLALPDIFDSVLKIYGKEVHLLIIGDGDMKKILKRMCKKKGVLDKCCFTGNRRNVNDYYNAMDVLILPSYHEGFPLVVVEAQTNGLFCVISDRVTNEVNITGNVHFLPIDDLDAWGKLISQLLKQEVNNRRDCEKLMKTSRYDISIEAHRLSSILSE